MRTMYFFFAFDDLNGSCPSLGILVFLFRLALPGGGGVLVAAPADVPVTRTVRASDFARAFEERFSHPQRLVLFRVSSCAQKLNTNNRKIFSLNLTDFA